MLISTADAKTLLGISDTTYDAKLALLIPALQRFVVEYTNNDFKLPDTDVSDTVSFSGAEMSGIDLTDSFTAGMDVKIEGTAHNNGIYEISSLTSEAVTFTESVVAEVDVYATVYRVSFPQDLKVAGVKWLSENLKHTTSTPVAEFQTGAYREQYLSADSIERSYKSILNKYRRARGLWL